MMLKVGDYIRNTNGKSKTTTRVEIVDQITNYIGITSGENVHIDDCEEWMPESQETCLFYDSLKEFPRIGKFKHYSQGQWCAFTTPRPGMNVQYFKHCIPLMGLQFLVEN